MASRRYWLNFAGTAWTRPGHARVSTTAVAMGPVSYATLTDAKTALGAPVDANYVTWAHGNATLETVFASLNSNDILVLPERAEPYLIDTSNGFMASGVSGVDGTGVDGLKDGSIVPIVSNSRLWFEMARSRRGILGMGPGAVIAPSSSSFNAPPQPVHATANSTENQYAYWIAGGSILLSGAQETLIGYDNANPFFANFTIQGRDMGGIAYSTIKRTGGTGTLTTAKQIHFDESWRSHAGVPNGECGAFTMNGGQYLIENCDLVSPSSGVAGGTAILWNNNTGGVVRHVRGNQGTKGSMWSFWKSGGTNTFEDVHILAGQTAMNIEQSLAGFQLDWTEGSIGVGLGYTGSLKFHFAGNPSSGAAKIALHGVTVSPNAYTPNALSLNVYTTSGVAKRSWITCDTMPISYNPSAYWIA